MTETFLLLRIVAIANLCIFANEYRFLTMTQYTPHIISKIELPSRKVGSVTGKHKWKKRLIIKPEVKQSFDVETNTTRMKFKPIYPAKYVIEGAEKKISFLKNIYNELASSGYVERERENSFIYTFSGIEIDEGYSIPIKWLRKKVELQAFIIEFCGLNSGDKTISTYGYRFMINDIPIKKLSENYSKLLKDTENLTRMHMRNLIDYTYTKYQSSRTTCVENS